MFSNTVNEKENQKSLSDPEDSSFSTFSLYC